MSQDEDRSLNVDESSTFQQIVLEAITRRRRREPSESRLEPHVVPTAVDQDSVRASLAVLLQIPISEVTDSVLDELVRRITADAESDAERVAAYLDQLIEHLQSLKCTSRQDVFEYFAAADRVLLELYAELRKPRPSPTRLLQLTVQYALDPRQIVDAPAHQLEIRRHLDGYEVAVLPPGYVRIRSIPYPGFVVRNPFTRQLLDLVLEEPPQYPAMMQLIEMLLEYVPQEIEGTTPPLTPVTPETAVQVDREDSCIIVFGRRYVVDLQLIHFVQALLETPGAWVSSTNLAEDPLFLGERIDRLFKKLPASVQELIESRPRKGYRLRLERLAQLCQKSSVVPPATLDDDENG